MNINDIIFKIDQGQQPESRLASNAGDKPSLCCIQPRSSLPDSMPIAMMYVPYQQWAKVYDPKVGLERGTIFEELDKPFIGERTI